MFQLYFQTLKYLPRHYKHFQATLMLTARIAKKIFFSSPSSVLLSFFQEALKNISHLLKPHLKTIIYARLTNSLYDEQ